MSFQVTTAQVQQYRDNVQLLLQQRGSKLRKGVMESTYTGKAAKTVEQIGAVSASKRTSRHQDTKLISTPHDARWVFPVDYDWADLIDDVDKLRILVELTSPYAVNGGQAMGRAIDDEIITAFFGTSKTGENGSTSTVFDTANQQVAAASSGLTVPKLRAAKKILMANEVDLDFDPLFCCITAAQHDDLLGQTQVVSTDFNDRPVLKDGKLLSYLGFNFIHCERIGVDGSSNRRVPVWAKSGMHLGVWNDINTSVDKRPDKNNSTQVLVQGTFGATRTEEGKVVEVLCVEA